MIKKKGISRRRIKRNRPRSHHRIVGRWSLLAPTAKVFLISAFAALLAAGYLFLTDRRSNVEHPTDSFEQEPLSISPPSFNEAINRILDDFGIKKQWIAEKLQGKEKNIKLPPNLPVTLLCMEIRDAVEKLGGDILLAQEDMKQHTFRIEIGYRDRVVEKLVLVVDNRLKRVGGKIALIIDDFGYHDDGVAEEFLKFDHKLTVSIIPGLKASKKIAQKAVQKGKEIMIHLPMESLDSRVEADGFTVFTAMSDEEVSVVVQKAIAEIPQARGMDNHMGSKATLDKRVMKSVMRNLKDRNLYFVDSMTNRRSIAFDTAKEMKVPCERNETFIDNPKSPQTIEQKLQLLVQRAQREGYAVGIGHAQRKTLEVLKKEIPRLEKKGFRFVYVSEIVR